jgi:hypothetical protein
MTDETRYNLLQPFWYILMVLLGMLILRELGQVLMNRMDYIKSMENWLEILLIIVTLTSCSGLVESIKVNRHLFAIAILLGWFELVLLLGELPVLSVQTEMLKRVSKTFLRYMAGYIVLILAFAFSFYILFEEDVQVDVGVQFTNPLISIAKTAVMLAGEFEASNLPFDDLIGTSHVIFLLFVFFVAIVLLNLLNGLAVGDTRKVVEKAETLSFVARVRLIDYIFDVHFYIPSNITRYVDWLDKELKLFPNKEKDIGSTLLRSLHRIITEKRERNKKKKTNELDEIRKLFSEKMSTLQLQCEKVQQMLNKILTHLDIPEP